MIVMGSHTPLAIRLLLPALLAACFDPAGSGVDGPAENVLFAERVLNIAHRGGKRLAPEATLPAYASAVELGVDVLEIDLRATADGVLVCLHDRTVDRTTDGEGAVDELTLAALRGLDAGYHFSPDGGATHPYRGQGVTVPTFAEVLDAFPGYHFSVEIKQTEPSIVDLFLAEVGARGVQDRIVLESISDAALREVRARDPAVHTALGLAELTEFLLLIDDTTIADYTPPARFLHPPWDAVGAAELDRARQVGLKTHVWTVNQRDDMELLVDLGVDGIMTDDPALLAEVLAGRAAR